MTVVMLWYVTVVLVGDVVAVTAVDDKLLYVRRRMLLPSEYQCYTLDERDELCADSVRCAASERLSPRQ
jgi:hypothetical protein